MKDKEFKFLYKITNLLTGKIYIGARKTICVDDGYMGSSKYLANDIKQFGIENFKREILEFFETQEQLADAERKMVNRDFVNRSDTYNLRVGGFGVVTSESAVKKLSSNQLVVMSEISQEKLKSNSAAMVAGIRSLSEPRRKQWNTNLSKAMKGNPNVISRAKKMWLDEESKAKRKEAISAGQKAYYSKNPMPMIQCTHCKREFTNLNFKKWHGDKCKLNPENMK